MQVPCFVVTAAEAEAERDAAPAWYRLPAGWTWGLVATQRAIWNTDPSMFPVVSAFGVTAWARPLRPKRDRVRVPRTLRQDHADFLATANCARTLPGGQLAARKALDNARFWRTNNDFRPAWG